MKIRSLTHWGLYDFHVEGEQLVDVTPVIEDKDPSPIGKNLLHGNSKQRISQPAIRAGYLNGRGKRGEDDFVSVPWDEAIDIAANALESTRIQHGNEAIYGGSYGWASAGRFHHAQSQLHRFLTCIGGYTASANAYSFAAAEVILPHVIGDYEALLKSPSSWQSIEANTELMVCFGGLPLRNGQITNGGLEQHVQRESMLAAAKRGVSFINISPMKSDVEADLRADWLPIRPGADVALMLALCHELLIHDQHDVDFLGRYCEGFDAFEAYLLGHEDDHQHNKPDNKKPKTPEWAAALTGIPAGTITELAARMARSRTMISLSWSLSRGQYGEQPYWAGISLAAMLGQMGTPGGGVGLGYCAENKVGKNVQKRFLGHLPRASNPVRQFIPVARIADMLMNPGTEFRYNGDAYRYPDIKLIYWAGGNPFHHHQDLNRLREAWQKPETVICHELVWNPLAKHADIVFPVASFLERNDIGGAPNEDVLVAMKQAVPAYGESKSDYEILQLLSRRLGVEPEFTEGRDETQWLKWIYEMTAKHLPALPSFSDFWDEGIHRFTEPEPHTLFKDFRANPETVPLNTPSGRIQFTHSKFGHATWHAPNEWLGNAGEGWLHLISHQPATRLHSQLDHGELSQSSKIQGREPIHIHPDDARRHSLKNGYLVRVYNERGAFVAGVQLSKDVMPGVLHIATGAWWAPDETGTCQNGNPNAVTQDIGTSDIAQGPCALTCLVKVARFSPQ